MPPVPIPSLSRLSHQAQWAFVGQARSITPEGETRIQGTRAVRMLAQVAVDRWVKGSLDRTTVPVTFLEPELPIGYGALSIDEWALFFVVQTEQERWTVADPYVPSMGVTSKAPSEKGATPLQRIVAEVAAAAASEELPGWHRESLLHLLRPESESVEDFYIARATLEALLRHPDPALRGGAVAALLGQGQVSVLQELQDALMAPSAVEKTSVVLSAIGALRVPEAVPWLAGLLRSRDVAVRRPAAVALRFIESRAAVGPLSEVLWDEDIQVRYAAVMGLAERTQDDHAPAFHLFQTDEQGFIDYWRARAKMLS